MSRIKKIPLGAPVIIDTITSKYNLENASNKDIALMPEGIVTAYCNEISGQFLLIKLRSSIEIKVTENELSECTRNYYFSDKTPSLNFLKSIKDFIKFEFTLNGNREIKYLINPFNFSRWIIYTIKDIF